jgi:hypothetical protein
MWIGVSLVGCTLGWFWLQPEPDVLVIGSQDAVTYINTSPSIAAEAMSWGQQPASKPSATSRVVERADGSLMKSTASFPQPVTTQRSLLESFEEAKINAKARAESAALSPFSDVR